jgi:hypothetical protein
MIKWLHAFTVNKTEEIQTEEKSKNDKGEETTTVKKETKEIPITLKIRKPNRRLYDDADLFYGVKLSEGIKAGLLTKTLLAKRYENDGGPMSNPEKEKYAKLYIDLYEKENEIQKVQLNLEKLNEKEKREQLTEVIIEMSTIKQELHQFELSQQSLFDQTAEVRARNQTIMWWVLNLSYSGEDEKEEVFFLGDTFDEKLNTYDEMEERANSFWGETIRKFIYFVSFWESGQITTEEEFEDAEKVFNTTLEEQEKVPEEEDGEGLKTAYEKAEEQEKAEEKAKEEAEKKEQREPSENVEPKKKTKRKAKAKDLATENA